jgi:signal transduction histidine kinase
MSTSPTSTTNTHRLQHSLEAVARGRYVMPMVLVLGIVAMAVNESTYTHSHSTLSNGIALTDARVQAAETLQHITDAGLYARSYLLAGTDEEAQAYREAVRKMREVKQKTYDLVAQVNPGGSMSVAEIERLVTEHIADSDRWVALMARGEREAATAAANSGESRARREQLRSEFDKLLNNAAQVQQTARFSLYQANAMSRWAVHILAFAAVLGMVLFRRQLRRGDEELAQERLLLADRVRERTAELTEMTGHLVHAREDERARIARELHDEMGGLLTAIKLDFARLRRLPDLPPKAMERMLAIESRLNEGIALKRRIIEHLRPSALDQLGLVSALEILCGDMAEVLGVPVHADLHDVSVGKNAELTLYRTAQEALTNIGKYAHCREVQVSMRQRGADAQLVVHDDGRGFEPTQVPHGHHGLVGMRVRLELHGGRLKVESAPGRGTTLTADLPVEQAAKQVVEQMLA